MVACFMAVAFVIKYCLWSCLAIPDKSYETWQRLTMMDNVILDFFFPFACYSYIM